MKKRIHIKSKVTKVEKDYQIYGVVDCVEELQLTIYGEHTAVLKVTFNPDADVDYGEMVDASYWSFKLLSTDHPPWQGLNRLTGRCWKRTLYDALSEISPELQITPSDDEIVLGLVRGEED